MEKFADIALLSKEAYDFMRSFDAEKMADGRYELGNGAYANVSTYITRRRSESVYEAHRLYTDIQWIIICRRAIISFSRRKLRICPIFAWMRPARCAKWSLKCP